MGVLEQQVLWPDALPDANLPLFPGLGTGSVVCWIAHTEAESMNPIYRFNHLNIKLSGLEQPKLTGAVKYLLRNCVLVGLIHCVICHNHFVN